MLVLFCYYILNVYIYPYSPIALYNTSSDLLSSVLQLSVSVNVNYFTSTQAATDR